MNNKKIFFFITIGFIVVLSVTLVFVLTIVSRRYDVPKTANDAVMFIANKHPNYVKDITFPTYEHVVDMNMKEGRVIVEQCQNGIEEPFYQISNIRFLNGDGNDIRTRLDVKGFAYEKEENPVEAWGFNRHHVFCVCENDVIMVISSMSCEKDSFVKFFKEFCKN